MNQCCGKRTVVNYENLCQLKCSCLEKTVSGIEKMPHYDVNITITKFSQSICILTVTSTIKLFYHIIAITAK